MNIRDGRNLFAIAGEEPAPRRTSPAHEVTNSLFLLATVLTAAGLWLLPERIGERGLVPARAASVVFLVGATAWLASLVFRLTVTPRQQRPSSPRVPSTRRSS